MSSAFDAEGKIDLAIEAMLERGFKLKTNRFGDEQCGCAVTAFAVYCGGRKPGQSSLSFASSELKTNEDNLWELVNGFDGKRRRNHVDPNAPRAIEMEQWYDAGQRLARKWVTHV